MDGQNDVRTMPSQNHPADTGLLTEEKKTRRSCRQRDRKEGMIEKRAWREGVKTPKVEIY